MKVLFAIVCFVVAIALGVIAQADCGCGNPGCNCVVAQAVPMQTFQYSIQPQVMQYRMTAPVVQYSVAAPVIVESPPLQATVQVQPNGRTKTRVYYNPAAGQTRKQAKSVARALSY